MSALMRRYATSKIAGRADVDIAIVEFEKIDVPQGSTVSLRSCGGGITAWKGTNTSFPNAYGIYIVDSNVHAANSSLNITGKCALGRPWNAQMRSIFAYTYLDKSILSTGYIDWNPARYNNYTLQAEYRDYGPGYNVTGRQAAKFDVQLTPEEWAQESYNLAKTAVYNFSGDAGGSKFAFPAQKGEKDPCGPVAVYRLDAAYHDRAVAAVKEQMGKAGVRLAFLLRENLK